MKACWYFVRRKSTS